MLDKLKFWKRDGLDDLSLEPPSGEEPDLGLPQPGQPEHRPDFSGSPSFTPQQFTPNQQFTPPQQFSPSVPRSDTHHEFEIISAKLDTLKMQLDAISQRLANLEQVANQDRPRRQYW